MKHKLESGLTGEISTPSDMQMTYAISYADDMAESKEELKSLFMKVEEQDKTAGLKLNISKNEDYGIQSHHFMANRWGNNGNSDRLYFRGPQNHCIW